jgi:DNA repair protein RadC
MMNPPHADHRKRLRDKLRRTGLRGFLDHEVLELLLTGAIPRRDTKPIARELLRRFGDLSGVLDTSQEELSSVKGMGPVSAALLRAVRETMERYLASAARKQDLLQNPETAARFARAALAGKPNECFLLIHLNTRNEAIGHETLHEGTIDQTAVYPRRIVEAALQKKASGVILVHNHPSGHPDPSEEDRALTRAIVQAARTVDLRVLDHLIVGRNGAFSFRGAGLLI